MKKHNVKLTPLFFIHSLEAPLANTANSNSAIAANDSEYQIQLTRSVA